jgi:hypothetical protein
MTTFSAFLDELSRLVPQQVLLRLVALVAPLIAVLAEVQAGATLQRWFVVSVVVLSVVAALLPDSHTGLLVVLLVGGHWAGASADGMSRSGWVLLMALALLLFHVACTLASYGPSSVVPDKELLVLWLRRSATAAAVAAIVWVTSRVASELELPGSGLVLGIALLVLVGWTALLARTMSVRA